MLRVTNLEVVYNQVVRVLQGVSLDVPEGAIVALLGPNGAGKTTTLWAITGLLRIHDGRVTKGAIEWRGVGLTGLAPHEIMSHGLAQVMEGRRVFQDLNVVDNLMSGAHQRRDRGEVKKDLGRLLDRFPVLRERATGLAGYLSGGEQQMLAIGRALMSRPKLLVLDEPSLGLAPKIVDDVAKLVGEINSEGMSILLVEQNANMALSLASHGYILENGKVVLDGTADELREDEDIQEFYLGVAGNVADSYRNAKLYKRRKRWLS